jgi:hypothetical protein
MNELVAERHQAESMKKLYSRSKQMSKTHSLAQARTITVSVADSLSEAGQEGVHDCGNPSTPGDRHQSFGIENDDAFTANLNKALVL